MQVGPRELGFPRVAHAGRSLEQLALLPRQRGARSAHRSPERVDALVEAGGARAHVSPLRLEVAASHERKRPPERRRDPLDRGQPLERLRRLRRLVLDAGEEQLPVEGRVERAAAVASALRPGSGVGAEVARIARAVAVGVGPADGPAGGPRKRRELGSDERRPADRGGAAARSGAGALPALEAVTGRRGRRQRGRASQRERLDAVPGQAIPGPATLPPALATTLRLAVPGGASGACRRSLPEARGHDSIRVHHDRAGGRDAAARLAPALELLAGSGRGRELHDLRPGAGARVRRAAEWLTRDAPRLARDRAAPGHPHGQRGTAGLRRTALREQEQNGDRGHNWQCKAGADTHPRAPGGCPQRCSCAYPECAVSGWSRLGLSEPRGRRARPGRPGTAGRAP